MFYFVNPQKKAFTSSGINRNLIKERSLLGSLEAFFCHILDPLPKRHTHTVKVCLPGFLQTCVSYLLPDSKSPTLFPVHSALPFKTGEKILHSLRLDCNSFICLFIIGYYSFFFFLYL